MVTKTSICYFSELLMNVEIIRMEIYYLIYFAPNCIWIQKEIGYLPYQHWTTIKNKTQNNDNNTNLNKINITIKI